MASLQVYRLATKAYLARGKDGYDVFKDCPVLVSVMSDSLLTNCIAISVHAIGVPFLYVALHT